LHRSWKTREKFFNAIVCEAIKLPAVWDINWLNDVNALLTNALNSYILMMRYLLPIELFLNNIPHPLQPLLVRFEDA